MTELCRAITRHFQQLKLFFRTKLQPIRSMSGADGANVLPANHVKYLEIDEGSSGDERRGSRGSPQKNEIDSGIAAPLFKGCQEPSEQELGFLVPLKCGHRGLPNELEKVLFDRHLREAGFQGKSICEQRHRRALS